MQIVLACGFEKMTDGGCLMSLKNTFFMLWFVRT